LLKVRRFWRESGKQAEIRLATLLKILQIRRSRTRKPRRGRILLYRQQFPLDMANSSGIARFVI
jgi:hypothetical protein